MRRYASAVYAIVVCLSVCLCVSVTLRYCIRTDKRRMQIMPHDSPGTLVFLFQRSQRSQTGSPPMGNAKRRWDRLKLATFDE